MRLSFLARAVGFALVAPTSAALVLFLLPPVPPQPVLPSYEKPVEEEVPVRKTDAEKLHDLRFSLFAKIASGQLPGVAADDPLNNCGDPCIISFNPGGREIAFRYAAHTLEKRRSKGAIINGICASACATFAALGRPRVCVTQRASFAFHRNSSEKDAELPDDIDAWVRANGAYPSYASGDFTMMRWPATLSFWPQCSISEPKKFKKKKLKKKKFKKRSRR